MNTMMRMSTGESLGKIVWPDIDNIIESTPKGDLESILLTAHFAAENAIHNRYILAPWLPETIIGKYDINYEPHQKYIVSHIRVEATKVAGIIAAFANIVSLVTLLDMFKSVTKNVYLADIITSNENYNIRQIKILQLPIEDIYLEATEGDIFPLSINSTIPSSICLQSTIVKEYDMIQVGDLWLEIIPDDNGFLVAKAVSSGSATITDKAFLIRGIKK